MEGEIKVTVIATGFEESMGKPKSSDSEKPGDRDLFEYVTSQASPKEGTFRPSLPPERTGQEEMSDIIEGKKEAPEEEPPKEKSVDDFDELFNKAFGTRPAEAKKDDTEFPIPSFLNRFTKQ